MLESLSEESGNYTANYDNYAVDKVLHEYSTELDYEFTYQIHLKEI